MRRRKNNNKIGIIVCVVLIAVVACSLKVMKEIKKEKPEDLIVEYMNHIEKQEYDDLELKQQIVDSLGKEGYSAIDIDNQVDMVNAEQVEEFCKNAEKKQTATITVFSVMEAGGFIRYDMKTQNGEIDVEVSSCVWKEGKPKADYYQKFQAYTWKYTENGYFFIEEYHPPGYDGAPGQTGFRVKPLDKTSRELNQKYVLPIGYELNNLLITDWDENNYKNLDFYDLYERMYRMKYGTYVPYGDNYGGAEYEIPKEEFEKVIQTYLKIESAVLQENAVYHSDMKTYRYRPRGLYDCEFPYEPYPEVISYKQQSDGTIKLTISAVWIRKELDQAFVSELVVRPLEECFYIIYTGNGVNILEIPVAEFRIAEVKS